jgi:hypothetical protein
MFKRPEARPFGKRGQIGGEPNATPTYEAPKQDNTPSLGFLASCAVVAGIVIIWATSSRRECPHVVGSATQDQSCRSGSSGGGGTATGRASATHASGGFVWTGSAHASGG